MFRASADDRGQRLTRMAIGAAASLAMVSAQFEWAYDLTPNEPVQPDAFVVNSVVTSTASLGAANSTVLAVAYVQNAITEDLYVAADPAEERVKRGGITDVRSGYVAPLWPDTTATNSG